MAQVFIRVELRGNPSFQDYENLHGFMQQKNWFRTINGTAGQSTLPHAMYHGISDTKPVDIATPLRQQIEASVWTPAVVLVIQSLDWGMNPA